MKIVNRKRVIRDLLADKDVLQEQLDSAIRSQEAWKRAATAAKEDLDMWRAKYELSQLTPEVKADTEAAFKRGAQFAKQQALQNVAFLLQNIAVDEPKETENA